MSKQNLDTLFECLSFGAYSLIDDKLCQACRQECDIFKSSVNDYYGKARNLEDMLWFVSQCRYAEAKQYSTIAKGEYENLLKVVYESSTFLMESREKSAVVKGNEVHRNDFSTSQTIHDTFPTKGKNVGYAKQFAVQTDQKIIDGIAVPYESTNMSNTIHMEHGKQCIDHTNLTQSTTLYNYGNITAPETQRTLLNDSTHGKRVLKDVTDKFDSIKKEQTVLDASPLRDMNEKTDANVHEFCQYIPDFNELNQDQLNNEQTQLHTNRKLGKNESEEKLKYQHTKQSKFELSKEDDTDTSSYSKEYVGSKQGLHQTVEKETEVKMSAISRSRAASAQLKRNNSNIVDLSDSNRPTKLAERFSEMYDNEWTEAFVYLDTHHKQKETDIIGFLLEVVTRAFRLCKNESVHVVNIIDDAFENVLEQGNLSGFEHERQENKERNRDTTLLTQYLKEHAGKAVKRLQKEFCEGPAHLKKIYRDFYLTWEDSPSTPIVAYVSRCVELTWWMCVQDPPIYMDTPESTVMPEFNATTYRAYTRTGRNIDYYVWPALLLEQGGAVLMKGVAQCK